MSGTFKSDIRLFLLHLNRMSGAVPYVLFIIFIVFFVFINELHYEYLI